MSKPRRRVEVEIRLGADSWDEAQRSLEGIVTELAMGRLRHGPVVSGSPSSGYVYEANEDESITHDSYFEALDEGLREPAPEVAARQHGTDT